MAVRGTTQGLALTPARWATWVAQRHEWNGYLWIRWSDAEAILLFVSGRPRIHLWDGAGWVEGEHARTTVAQRLERLPPPRRGPVRSHRAAGVHDGGAAPPQEGVLQIYRGRVALDLSPPSEPPPLRGFTPPPEVEVTPARTTPPARPVEVPPLEGSPVQMPPAEAAASSAGPPTEAPAVPETTPPQSPASEVPAAAAPAPAAHGPPPAPAAAGGATG